MVATSCIEQLESILKQIRRNISWGTFETEDLDLNDRDLLLMKDAFLSSTRQKSIGDWVCSNNPEIGVAGYRAMCTIITSQHVVIRSLALQYNCISSESAQCLATMLQGSNCPQSLHSLDLGQNPEMGVDGFVAIMNGLATNTTIQYLEMNHTVPSETRGNTTDQTRLGLAAQSMLASKTTRLKEFRFENSGLGDGFYIEFAKGLKQNHTVEHLTMAGTMSIGGCTELGKALRYNDTLSSLEFDEFQSITDLLLVTLFEALEYNTTLRSISLFGNECTFTEATFRSVMESFEYNDTLESFGSNSSTRPIDKLLQLREEKGRTAPKKGAHKRHAIYSFLMLHFRE